MKIVPMIFMAVCAMFAMTAPASAQNLLVDGDFDSATSPWVQRWYPAEAGIQIVQVASRTDPLQNGLKMYSEGTTLGSFAYYYNEVAALPGETYQGSAYMRSVSWVDGSALQIQVAFFDSNHLQLGPPTSAGLPGPDTTYTAHPLLTTPAAPEGTAYVRFTCYLSKPATATSGITIGYFDDCSLALLSRQALLTVQNPVLGFGNDLTSLSSTLGNAGSGTATWSITPSSIPAWLNVSPASGSIASGAQVPLTLTVNRAAMPAGSSNIARIAITGSGGSDTIEACMEVAPQYTVPQGPTLAEVVNGQLIVHRRLPDGTLAAPVPWTVKGVAWSPALPGTAADNTSKRTAFGQCYRLDIQMLREMGCNTITLYLDPGTTPEFLATSKTVLDYCYLNGIMVIMSADEGADNTANIARVMQNFASHPAVLGFSLGNEWNLDLQGNGIYYKTYHSVSSAAAEIESSAQAVISGDLAANPGFQTAPHPVFSILGDDVDQAHLADLTTIMSTCKHVGFWGVNAYRGPSMGSLFGDWASLTSGKPFFISEMGADAFATSDSGAPYQPSGYEDGATQATWNSGLWNEVKNHLSATNGANLCAGACLFSWTDEWSKDTRALPGQHGTGGFPTGNQPDGILSNEAWYGIVDVYRRRRPAYDAFKALYAASSDARLIELATSAGALTPAFDPANAGPYAITVSYTTASVPLTGVTSDPAAAFTITTSAGTVTGTSAVPFTFPLSTGANTATFAVTAQDGSPMSYTVAVTRSAAPVPTVTTLSATGITGTSAVLNGTINANGGSFSASFDWGGSISYGSTATGTPSTVSGSTTTAVSASLTGLTPGTTYHFKLNGGQVPGNDVSFTTLAAVITTGAATSITSTSAVLNGSINASGGSVDASFLWGLDTSYGTTTTGSPSTVTGTTTTAVSATLTGLNPGTTYHFKLSGGTDAFFTTLAPVYMTLPATSITATSAVLNGTVNANGGSVPALFPWGLSTSYGNTIAGTPSTVTGTTTTGVSATLTGLNPGTTYHFKLSGGSDAFFTTLAPVYTTLPATNITGTSAVLNGTINANGASVPASFAWGPSPSYGNLIAGTPPTVSGSTATAVSATLTGLTPGNTYHFKLSGGADAFFTTPTPNIDLASLSLGGVAFSPAFNAATTSYTASVPNATASVSLTATTADPAATLIIAGSPAAQGTPVTCWLKPDLTTTLDVLVASQDGGSSKTYHLTVTRTVAGIGPDAFGYTANAVSYTFMDISTTGTPVLDNADDATLKVPLGFSAQVYGSLYSNVFLSSNGLLSFGAANGAYQNQDLNTVTAGGGPVLAPLWRDWVTSSSTTDKVWYATVTVGASKVFIAQWDVTPYGGTGEAAFQAQIYDSGVIFFSYKNVSIGGAQNASAAATIGIQNAGGGAGRSALQWSYDTVSLDNGATLQFTPPAAPPHLVVEQPAGVAITSGALVSFTATALGSGVAQPFTLRNTGTGTLSGLALSFDGPNSTEFGAGTVPATLAPGASVTVNVTFTPSAAGTRTAALHIASNDTARNPFNVSLSGVTNSFTYTAATTPGVAWVEISSTGKAILDGQDDAFVSIPIGFSFSFWGVPYTSLYVSSNGLLTFGSGYASGQNVDLQSSSPGMPVIAVLWDDFVTNRTSVDKVYYYLSGAAGSRALRIQWNVNTVTTGGGDAVFQATLYENGVIRCMYKDVTFSPGVGGATIGLQDASGSTTGRYKQWSFNSASVAAGTTIDFRPAPNGVKASAAPPAGTGGSVLSLAAPHAPGSPALEHLAAAAWNGSFTGTAGNDASQRPPPGRISPGTNSLQLNGLPPSLSFTLDARPPLTGSHATPLAGTYAFVLTAADGTQGKGAVTVQENGVASLAAVLPDGSAFTSSAVIAGSLLSLPDFQTAGGRHGTGWLQFGLATTTLTAADAGATFLIAADPATPAPSLSGGLWWLDSPAR